MPSFVKNPKDFLAGLIFLATSALFGFGIFELPIGTAFRMGPGYFPLVLCIILAVLGAIIMFNGIRWEGERITNFSWRGLLVIILPVIFFGATLRGFGFVISLSLAVFLTSIASAHFKWWVSLINVAVITFFGWLIFIWGLGLPIQVWGPWVGGY